MEALFLITGLAALVLASYSDVRTREVPDFLSYGLVFIGIGYRLVYSLAYWDYSYIIEGLAGLLVFFGLSYVMFYSGQWGGGDSKVLMGIGALFGLKLDFYNFNIAFLINTLVVGAVYGLVWSIVLAISRRKSFTKELKEIVHEKNMLRLRKFMLMLVAILIIVSLFIADKQLKLIFFIFIAIFLFAYYTWIFTKAVEKSCLLKSVDAEQLTEGDWIVNDIFVGSGKNKRRITGPKDLGIEMKQIKQLIALKRNGKFRGKVLIKEGIPFVPSFLLGFILTYLCGNLILAVL